MFGNQVWRSEGPDIIPSREGLANPSLEGMDFPKAGVM